MTGTMGPPTSRKEWGGRNRAQGSHGRARIDGEGGRPANAGAGWNSSGRTLGSPNMGKRATEEVLSALALRPAGCLLDVPAGNSPVARGARALGWRVVGLDLFPPRGFAGVRGDACRSFPFRDRSFDALLSIEGIEHFENQAAFLRECARVLKPGGLLLLTTPNVMHLSARMSAFLTGQRHLRRGFVNEDQTLR